MEPHIILIVDDDDQIRERIQLRLEALGHSIVAVENGAAGMNAMARVTFDVVITDVLMPVRNGLELVASARSKLDRTPIIAMSGGGVKGPASYLDSAAGLGADVVLPKPCSLTELTAAIRLVTIG